MNTVPTGFPSVVDLETDSTWRSFEVPSLQLNRLYNEPSPNVNSTKQTEMASQRIDSFNSNGADHGKLP